MNDLDWMREGLKKPGKKKGELARAMGVRASAISELLQGDRKLLFKEAIDGAAYLEVDLPMDLPKKETVSLVGYVGAGATTHLYADGQGPFDQVDAPDNATKDTVAVEVRGDSLGALFDHWLVYYDDVHTPPTSGMIGRLCVVGLADGRILVKQLKRGQLPDHFNLMSNTEPPIYDVIVDWAALVKSMTPR